MRTVYRKKPKKPKAEQPRLTLECKLPSGNIISCTPVGDGTFYFVFNRQGAETTIKLTADAVKAIHVLWVELCDRGLATQGAEQ